MLVLEEKFKEAFGKDYFPYFVATLSVMMTYIKMRCYLILFP